MTYLNSSGSMNTDPRPMLARDADSMYWLSRYVERAEHVARLLRVNSILLTDVGDLTPELEEEMWFTILKIMRAGDLPAGDGSIASRICHHMTFGAANNSSIMSCVAKARENARGIREIISTEMWECLNGLYWYTHGDDARTRFDDSSDEFYRTIMTGSMTFQGLTDQTMPHDQRWNFASIAKHLERIDITARVVSLRFDILHRMTTQLDQPIRNIHMMGVLRSCCSLEAYRRAHMADLDPMQVASFLIMQTDYPRSIRYAVESACDAIQAVRVSNGVHTPSAPERILGRLGAQLEYADLGEILAEGLPSYLNKITAAAADASLAVQKAYFLY